MTEVVENNKNNGISDFVDSNSARKILQVLALPKNSHIELFPDSIQLELKDIGKLTEQIGSKLAQLRVDANSHSMKAVISFNKGRSYQLVGWNQIRNFNWDIPERTNAVILTWEFFYNRDEGSDPELHVISVKVTESLNPMQVLRAALSRDREDMDSLEIRMAPVVCEIDYHDNLLSRELVQIVSTWHKSLRRPAPLLGIGKFIQKKQERISTSIQYSLELLVPIAYIAGIYLWMHNQFESELTTQYLSVCTFFILLFFFVTRISDRIARWLSTVTSRSIDRMGRLPIFELTNGDNNLQTEAYAKVTTSTYKFWATITVSFLINIASTIFTFYVLNLK